jgi:peptidoglycan biosynthesis protein MviN/MurJ (putative lipid II flippase)
MSRHRPLAAFAGGAALLNLALSIVLVHPLGVKGVALATLVAYTIEVFVFVWPYALRTIGFEFREVLHEVVAPVAMPVPIALAALYGLRALVDPRSLVSVIAVGAVGGLVYAATYAAACARPEERALLRQLPRRLSQALHGAR